MVWMPFTQMLYIHRTLFSLQWKNRSGFNICYRNPTLWLGYALQIIMSTNIVIQTAWCSWVSVSPILAAFFALLLSLPDVTEIMVLGIAYRIVGFILTTIWHWWNSSNLAQTDFPVYNATGGDTSRTIAAPRLTGIWNLAIDKLLHDTHVQTCYRTLGRSGYEDADLKSWQRALRASPGLSPMVTKYTKRSQQIAATFDPNFPNNIKLDMDLVCALEEAQAGSSLFI